MWKTEDEPKDEQKDKIENKLEDKIEEKLKDKPELNNLLKIYSTNEEHLRYLGQILTSPKSRQIYTILTKQQLTAKEIGHLLEKNDNPRLPNIIFHLDKMTKIGIINIELKYHPSNGHHLKYYKAIPIILVLPEEKYEKVLNSNTLFNYLKNVFKSSLSFD